MLDILISYYLEIIRVVFLPIAMIMSIVGFLLLVWVIIEFIRDFIDDRLFALKRKREEAESNKRIQNEIDKNREKMEDGTES